MSTFDSDNPDVVAVVCPVCRTRIHALVHAEAGHVECPDCFTTVNVPALEAVLAMRPPERKVPDPGTYTISAEAERPRREQPGEPEFARFACPHCRAHLTPELKKRARMITCPDCLEVVEVPALDEWRTKHGKRRRKRRRPTPGSYDVNESPLPDESPGEAAQSNVFDAQAEIRRDPPPPIPAWTFFTRVFSVPWHAEILSRWIYMSLGCTVFGFLAAVIHWLLVEGLVIVLPFFALPIIWMTILTGSFTASCFLTVVEDTASGNDRIHNWNEGGWKVWMVDALGLMFLATIAWSAAYGIAKLTTAFVSENWFWPVYGLVFLLMFPVVLLSSLQAGSRFVPLTLPVVRTLYRKTWAWLVYFLLAVAVSAVYLFPVVAGLQSGWWFLPLLATGPILAAVLLIEARLLGRLAWRTLVLTSKPAEAAAARPATE